MKTFLILLSALTYSYALGAQPEKSCAQDDCIFEEGLGHQVLIQWVNIEGACKKVETGKTCVTDIAPGPQGICRWGTCGGACCPHQMPRS